jgi:cytochrome P450
MGTAALPASAATRRPPGPKGHLLWGNLLDFRGDMLGFWTRCAREYGDVCAFRLGPRRCLLVNHPDLIEDVVVTNARNFIKHFALRISPVVLGHGLLSSEGDFWLRQRRLAQPAFSRQRVAAYGEVVVRYTERMIASWKDCEEHDLHADMLQLALGIVAKALFDADVTADAHDVGDALETAVVSFAGAFTSLFHWPLFLPTQPNRRLKRAIRRLDAIIYRFIDQRRASGEDKGDLLSMLLRARDEDDGSRMTDKQLRDEMMTLFLAGHETTAIVMAWTCYLLATNPDAAARLNAELDQVLGGRAPTVADLPRLPYTEYVIQESMRLYPPAYCIGREPLQDCVIGGFKVPAGRTIFMSQWVMHRDPRYFDDPEKFLPERWASDKVKAMPKYAYFPFGGGPRICIGVGFALMETCLILATMAQKWQLTLTPGHTVQPLPQMTLRPANGVHVTIHRREDQLRWAA